MQFLLSELKGLPEVKEVFAQHGLMSEKKVMFAGLEGSLKHVFMGLIHQQSRGPSLVITADNPAAEKIYADLEVLFPGEVEVFPGENLLYFSEMLGRSSEIADARIKVMQRLLAGEKILVVAPLTAVLPRLLPPDFFREKIFSLKKGSQANLNETVAKLFDIGYQRVSTVESQGQLSLKGGILDIFSPGESWPVRVEFFGDNIESLRVFEPETQRSRLEIDLANIAPAREIFLEEEQARQGGEKIFLEAQAVAENLKNAGNVVGSEKLLDKIEEMLLRLKEDKTFLGVEQYFANFYGQGNSILDYLSARGKVILDEPLQLQENFIEMSKQLKDIETSLLLQGDILPSQTEYYWDFFHLLERYSGSVTGFSLFSRQSKYFHPDKVISPEARTLVNYHGQWDMLLTEIATWQNKNYRIIFVCSRAEKSESLKIILEENGLQPLLLPEITPTMILPRKTPIITTDLFSSGFLLPGAKTVLITEKELEAHPGKVRVRRRKKEGLQLADYRELKTGDFVVHEQHGIGSYQGVRTLHIGETGKDYLLVKYRGTDKLYIPTDQIDIIQKYVGSEGKAPKLSALSSQEWSKAKAKVKRAVEDIARELIALYSERKAVVGHSFPPDQDWQKEFEGQFPYRETPDQLRAIEEIKKDMEKDQVMERLVCGDVGYGKTEVALRAAFKAIIDGKQVAFLVPTTILAQQHFRTFQERFQGYPITVGLLSRFRTAAQQKETIKDLRRGGVDLLVATHRLLSGDLRFKDLGLLVIDEEQRFGVKQKEKIKMLKKNVDVLTLTATPIPRTLHMSLVGARDLSIIETPPEDRYPVQTYVVEYSDFSVREAILREVRRGGQVYFVYNRVKSIDKWVAHLQKIMPEIRIGMGHGQMSEARLEKVMLNFLEKKYDVLISTTIIESGLDLPNVNTMIIYDADKLGLAQLYQLRGRIGRSSRVAYCYLTYQKDKILTEVAEKRLQAIKEFTELGAGLKIALRDMEIRGVGNLLGAEQHGFMTTIGFDLYTRFLENSIRALKGEKAPPEKTEMRVELEVDAYIPQSYIYDQEQKIEVYRKIAQIQEEEDGNDIEVELRDRYGPLPVAVYNLLKVALLKNRAGLVGVSDITEEGKIIKISLLPGVLPDNERLWQLISRSRGKVKVSAGTQGYAIKVLRKGLAEEQLLDFLLKLLEELRNTVSKVS